MVSVGSLYLARFVDCILEMVETVTLIRMNEVLPTSEARTTPTLVTDLRVAYVHFDDTIGHQDRCVRLPYLSLMVFPCHIYRVPVKASQRALIKRL